MIKTVQKKVNSFLDKFGIGGELLRYLWKERLWWLMPIVLFLVIVSFLLVFVQGAATTPFIYALF